MKRASTNTRPAVTLVELLVTIGLIGMLLGLTIPAVQRARENAAQVGCVNNLKQIGIALHSYHDLHGRLPPAQGWEASNPQRRLSWMALILPHIEQDALWDLTARACALDPIPIHNPPHVGYATPIPLYVCPDDDRLLNALQTPTEDRTAFTDYIGIAGSIGFTPDGVQRLSGVLGDSPGIRFVAVTDGTSQSIMVGERPPPDSLQAGRWYTGSWHVEPFPGPDEFITLPSLRFVDDVQCVLANLTFGPGVPENPCDRYHLWSLHPGGANFLFADGSARFISYGAYMMIPALATRRAGEVISIPD